MGEIIFHVCLLVFFTGFYIHSFSFEVPLGIQVVMHPGTWPRIIFGIGIILILYSLIKTLLSMRKKKMEGEAAEKTGKILTPSAVGPIGIGVFVLIAIAILYRVGFIVSSLFLVLASMYWIKREKGHHLLVIGLSAGTVLLFVLVFATFLNISFPRGYGIFRELSYLFY
jgi:hypothetical protein